MIKPNVVEVSNFSNKSVPSIIVSDLNIQGDLVSEGAIEIGGNVKGNVRCHHVTIRKGAQITGDIESDNLIINGAINGTITAKNISITASGEVKGTIEYGYLSVEAGANIDCRCKKKNFKELEDVVDQEQEFIPQIENILSDHNKSEEDTENDNGTEKSENNVTDISEQKSFKKKRKRKSS